MHIFINDEKVDFTLESEKTFADVIDSLEQWLAGQKMVILAIEMDKIPLRQTDLDAKKDLPVAAIGEIRLTASDFVKLEMDGVRALTEFFTTLKKGLAAVDQPALLNALGGFSQAEGTLRFILDPAPDSETGRRQAEFGKLFAGTTVGMIKVWEKDTRARAVTLCDFFLGELTLKSSGYNRLAQSSRNITAETIAKLRHATERLKGVSVLLQTGKDGEAMQSIASFTELAQLFLHLVSDVLTPPAAPGLQIEGDDLESYSQALNGHLRELVEAFENKDYILIGDLCEYEIAPKMISLIDTVAGKLSA